MKNMEEIYSSELQKLDQECIQALYGDSSIREELILSPGKASISKCHNDSRSIILKSNFPKTLMHLLDENLSPDIISWHRNGQYVQLKDWNKFMIEVYPRYFPWPAQRKIFLRMLRMWGFKECTKGGNNYNFYHEMFQRGLPNSLQRMTMAYR